MYTKMRLMQSYYYCLQNTLKYCTVVNRSNFLTRLWTNEQSLIYPEKLLKKKHKYPEYIYINSLEGAKSIANIILKNLPTNSTIVEVNPGIGFLSSLFLNNENVRKLILYEIFTEFLPKFEELHSLYPDRIEIINEDFTSLWKLAFRDKFDNGTRLQDALKLLPIKNFNDDINLTAYAGVGSINFFKHLIKSLVFEISIYSHGRSEMYLIVPPLLYILLACNKDAGYLVYRATAVLFQIMFEYEFICKIPRIYFLPTLYDNNGPKKLRVKKVNNIDPEFVYLIRIVPRKNLYELCPLEEMPALWYFVKQALVSRKNRIIPQMEKWVPGCGSRLILNLSKTKTVHSLYNMENEPNLPQFTVPCTTMSTEDYFPKMNIFTQFGELNPSQILTLFSQFREWPEYKESTFLASLESSLLKMEQSSEEINDSLELEHESIKETSNLGSKIKTNKNDVVI